MQSGNPISTARQGQGCVPAPRTRTGGAAARWRGGVYDRNRGLGGTGGKPEAPITLDRQLGRSRDLGSNAPKLAELQCTVRDEPLAPASNVARLGPSVTAGFDVKSQQFAEPQVIRIDACGLHRADV